MDETINNSAVAYRKILREELKMNKGTRIRTALRIACSIYSATCVWQVAIAEFGDMIGVKWLAIVCAGLIVISGWAVDALTTYYNNDYTVEGDTGTKITREMKKLSDFAPATVTEPEDAHIVDESEAEHGKDE